MTRGINKQWAGLHHATRFVIAVSSADALSVGYVGETKTQPPQPRLIAGRSHRWALRFISAYDAQQYIGRCLSDGVSGAPANALYKVLQIGIYSKKQGG